MRVGGWDVGSVGFGTAGLAFSDVTFDHAVAAVRSAISAGARAIDTALAYSRADDDSFAERAVAAGIAASSVRSEVLIATKGGHRRRGRHFPVDARPESLRSDCELSLRALGVDAIDLYQLHHIDPRVPLVESIGALTELQVAGKVRHIGLSNVSIDDVETARGVAPIASVQNRLSYSHRGDMATARFCAAHDIAYLAYMPLGGRKPGPVEVALTRVAQRHGVSTQRVQLAWLLNQGIPILPLVGATRPASMLDSFGATDLNLSTADMDALAGNDAHTPATEDR